MSLEANKELVVSSWTAIADGNIDYFLNNLHDEIVWVMSGTHVFSGTFRSQEEIMEKLLGPLGGVLDDNGLTLHVDTVTAEENRVIMQVRGEATTTKGKEYNNSYAIVVEVKDNKIYRIREYLDTEMVTATFGRSLDV